MLSHMSLKDHLDWMTGSRGMIEKPTYNADITPGSIGYGTSPGLRRTTFFFNNWASTSFSVGVLVMGHGMATRGRRETSASEPVGGLCIISRKCLSWDLTKLLAHDGRSIL